MSFWQIITPSEVTNLITNPSIETATTGWTAVGASIARSATYQKWGVYALKVTPTATLTDGVYFGTVTLVAGYTYTFSAWVRGAAGVTYTLYFADTSGNVLGTPVTFTGTGAWERQQVTYQEGVNTTRRLYITKSAHASTADFYIDGAVCEVAPAATTYVDGDQEGCVWLSTAHASQSKRDMMNRAGGTITDLADVSTFVTRPSGGGMPRMQNVITPYGILDGGSFQRSVARSRVFQLGVRLDSTSLQGLHAARNDLLALFAPDRVAVQQPLRIRYTGGAEPVMLGAVYESGAEAQGDTGYGEDMILRFACEDPYWYGEGDGAAVLNMPAALAVDGIYQRSPTGAWTCIGVMTGTAGVNCMARDAAGNLYVGGYFDTVDGVANTSRIAKWDGANWTALGTGGGGVGTSVTDMAFDAAGNLYVAGDFTDMGGVAAADYLAKWDGSAWSSIGVLTGGRAKSLSIDGAGNLFVTGFFTQIDGVARARCAKRTPAGTWSSLGTGLSNDGYTCRCAPDGKVYFSGLFVTADGVTVNYVAYWNGTTFVAMGAGLNNIVFGMCWGPNGMMYLAGPFTNAGGIAAADYVASWNGNAWGALAGAPAGDGWLFYDDVHGHIALMTELGAWIWNGSTWVSLDIGYVGAGIFWAYDVTPDGTVTIGGSTDTAITFPTVTTVSNPGTAKAFPVITVTGPGTLTQITNWSTLKSLWFSGLTLVAGEVLTIDLRPGKKTVTSNVRGNLLNKLVPGSALAEFCLLAGTNSLSVASNDNPATLTGTIKFTPRYWSADGAS